MSYFLPSFFQKRLLRYALSRLELLDTDALDLERLDIDWGRRSTVELRDVGLRKNKLASLLELPEYLAFEHASIALLRITIPADLHTSAITVELRGVEARLKVLEHARLDEPELVRDVEHNTNLKGNRRGRKEVQFSSLRSSIQHEGSTLSSDDGDERLPTAHDLAASFLAEESSEEKEQLEAAFNSQSTADLRQSIVSTGSGDDETNFGTGIGLGLPSFLAAFLKGIGDRLQVHIRNVTIKLQVDIDNAAEEGVRHTEDMSLGPTTIALFIDEIDVREVENVTTPTPSFSKTSQHSKPKSSETPVNLFEKRRIILRNVLGAILSDNGFVPPLSPVLEEKSVQDSQQTPRRTLPTEYDFSMQMSESSTSILDPRILPADMPREIEQNYIEDSGDISSGSSEHQGYFDTENSKTLSTTFTRETHFDNALEPSASKVSDSLMSQLDAAIEQSVAFSRMLSADKSQNREANSSESYSGQFHDSLRNCREDKSPLVSSSILRNRGRFSRTPSPQTLPSHQARSTSPSVEALNVFQHKSPSSERSSSRSTEVGPSNLQPLENAAQVTHQDEDNLTQSMLFSREEAESIYMSVINDSPENSSGHFHIPGAWDDTGEEIASHNRSFLVETVTSPESRGRAPCHQSRPHDSLPGSGTTDVRADSPLVDTSKSKISNSELNIQAEPTSHSFQQPISARAFLNIAEADFWITSSSTLIAKSDNASTPFSQDSRDSTRSGNQQLPGSFSLYAESKSSLRSSGFVSRTSLERNANENNQHKETMSLKTLSESFYELIIRSVQCRIDVSVCRVFTEVLRKIRAVSDHNERPITTKAPQDLELPKQKENLSTFAIRVSNIKAEFMDTLESQTLSTTNNTSSGEWNTPPEGLLFILKASKFEWSTANTLLPQSKLDIGKFSFGFNDQNIISFNKQAKIRSSLRDVQSSSDIDISVTIEHVKNTTEININTKPLQLLLNLQRLDNTLGSMGGLSGLMELGNSVTSESTIIAPPSKLGPRSRGVRFVEGPPTSESRKAISKPRINIRIGGLAAAVEGKSCSVKLQTTAIKLVSRDTIFGLQVDDIRLSGPHTVTQPAGGGVSIRLKNTGLKYLQIPEEHDLTRLISLLTPSKDKFEDDDDFLVDTLIRQRRKGSVLRTNIAKFEFELQDVDALRILQDLVDEAAKMSTVTKYLPEESRPGLMTLGMVDQAIIRIQTNHKIGLVSVGLRTIEFAHINLPSLIAVSLGKVAVDREKDIAIITEALPLDIPGQPPMLMARMIGDELEPTVKLKLWNICFEYSVPLIVMLLNIPDDTTLEDMSLDLSASIAALTNPRELLRSTTLSFNDSQQSSCNSKPLAINLALRDCAIGLTPRNISSKAMFVVTDGCIFGAMPNNDGFSISVELRKAGMLIIDDSRKLANDTVPPLADRNPSSAAVSNHIPDLCSLGYVSVCAISAATVMVKLTRGSQDAGDILDIDFKDELFLLETCADSTQTLIETLNGLKPPFPPSKGQKYRTEITPMQDMMASFTGDAFTLGAANTQGQGGMGLYDISDEDLVSEFDDLSDFMGMSPDAHPIRGDKLRGYSSAHLESLGGTRMSNSKSGQMRTTYNLRSGNPMHETSPPRVHVVGKKWDSTNNRYITVDRKELASCPVQIRIRDVHVIWHLFDGYDWERTRDTITKAVHDVEAKAEERRIGRRFEENDDKESVIGDFLFNSIYIGIPINQDPQELTRQINRNLDDLVSETASHTSTANSRPTSSHRTARNQGRKLKLDRSKRHKVVFELRGVSADILMFTPSGETQTSIDLRIADFEIFDHVPTSTWKKFLTYMHDAGPRDEHKPMIHLEICDVKPVPELTATELVIRVTVLPVRLHVDQDALDFITRFFDFQDDTRDKNGPPTEQPYLQRVEVRAVPIKLDYKPKKIDYAGLRSGRTTEFMNFFILDGADMVLKHTIVYGTSGFAKLHKSLEDVWMPDIRRNQLPSVLSGLNGVRTLVNVGTGIRDLVVIPVREYKKDGRIVRSISKGALAFAKTTGGELTRFGAKLAVGAQTALQGAEDFFVGPGYPQGGIGGSGNEPGWEGTDLEAEERRAISHYANQPTGILQGLKGAARSLERDLLVTKDIIIAVSGEARESGTAEGAARAVARHAPTLILRPMIGASKAISQTLMGATNTVDPQNRRRIEDKYKRY